MPTTVLLTFWMNDWDSTAVITDRKGYISLRDTTVFTAVATDRTVNRVTMDESSDEVIVSDF